MALATPATLGLIAGAKPGAPTFAINLSFPGDGAYPTGGTLAFQTFVRAALDSMGNPNVQIVAVIGGNCGGYKPVYIPSTGALMVYYNDNDAVADGPDIQVPNATDLSAVTFNVTVLCQ